MKKTIKFLLLGSLPFLFILYLTFLYNIIKSDWNYAHKSMYTYQNPFDWFQYKTKASIVKSIINFRENKILGLKVKRIYLEEQKQKELLIDTPKSTKIWKEGFHYNQNNKLNTMEARFRGDNPKNWLFEKKHWRIKVKKEDIINQLRYFDYYPFDFKKYISGKIANDLGLLSPNFNLVELFVNDRSQGVYIESENLNESFLRRKKIMPVNIYKAEQILDESVIAIEPNVFNSPGVLTKNATFNQLNYEDKSDLIYYLELIRLSYDDNEYFKKLVNNIGVENWVKFVSYQILTQNFHNDNTHNFRLVSDPWSGTIIPIVQDPLIGILDLKKFNTNYSSNDLILLLNLSSIFNHKKLSYIYEVLDSNKVKDTILDYKKIQKKVLISEKRDVDALIENFNIIKLLKSIFYQNLSKNDYRNDRIDFLKNYDEYLKKLQSYFEIKPKGVWKKDYKGFQIVVNGNLPISNLEIYFKDNPPNWIGLDINENGKIDSNEKKFKVDENKGYFSVPYSFYSNRINLTNTTNFQSHIDLEVVNTRFKFITSDTSNPYLIKFKNIFTNKKYLLDKGHLFASPASQLNIPVNLNIEKNKSIKIINDTYNIDNTTIFDSEVIIEPGTKFKLKKDKSIIFRNKVTAKGTKEKPIIFERYDDENWGTVAFLGKKTEKSKLSNLILDGGSGHVRNNFENKNNQYFSIGNIRFISALSVHKASNITFKNINIKNNKKYDDALHIIYSKDIIFDNLQITNSFGDAVDIDMSKNILLKNLIIKNSNNDAVDLMESSVIINNSLLVNSRDKGVSVGEKSILTINDSQIENNKIGISTKDGSLTFVNKTNFEKNNSHIQNYKKNWRYGDGGITIIKKSFFDHENVKNSKLFSKKSPISIDKFSSIKIEDSILGNLEIKKDKFSEINKSSHLNVIKDYYNNNLIIN